MNSQSWRARRDQRSQPINASLSALRVSVAGIQTAASPAEKQFSNIIFGDLGGKYFPCSNGSNANSEGDDTNTTHSQNVYQPISERVHDHKGSRERAPPSKIHLLLVKEHSPFL